MQYNVVVIEPPVEAHFVFIVFLSQTFSRQSQISDSFYDLSVNEPVSQAANQLV